MEKKNQATKDGHKQDNHDKQVEGLIDSMIADERLVAPYSCVVAAALRAAGGDCENGHTAPVEKLLPEATSLANLRAKSVTSWDWKASVDEILDELNRVLVPHHLVFRVPDVDTGDQIELELWRTQPWEEVYDVIPDSTPDPDVPF